MIVLDTNVVSALMNETPDLEVAEWLDSQPRTSVWTTSVTVLEIRFGLQILALGRRRSDLIEAFESFLSKIEHRIAVFDEAAANEAGELMASRQKLGRSREFRDTMIAGIVLAHSATL